MSRFQKDNSNGSKDNRTSNKGSKSKTANSSKRRRNCNASNNDPESISANGANDRTRSSMNDPSWYTRYPELASDASKFPFSLPLGKPLPIDVNSTYMDTSMYYASVPGVMEINWTPTIGISDSKNSAVNIAAREIYSFVRHANSGHSNYDAPDLMMYLLAMDSAYSMYAAAVRAYGTMMLYNGMNRYAPKSLVEAQGFSFDDLSQNLAQFRWVINQMAYKLSALYVPSGMTYYDRHIWMNSSMFVDGESAKSQTYVFRQEAIYIYDATKSNNYQVRLKYVNISDEYGSVLPNGVSEGGMAALNLMKVSDFERMMNDIINPILADEAMNIMSGDILKAFGSSNLFIVSPIDENYVTVPVYSKEVMSQIQNLTVMGTIDRTGGYAPGNGADIIQVVYEEDFSSAIIQTLLFSNKVDTDTTWILSKTETSAYSVLELDRILTCEHNNPSSDEILVATRLMNICTAFQVDTSEDRPYYMATPTTCSTEVVNSLKMWVTQADGNYRTISLTTPYIAFEATVAQIPNTWDLLNSMAAFDWHPTIPSVGLKTDSTLSATFCGYWCETMDYTVLTSQDLERMHEACLYSMFQVPDMRKLSSKPY